MTNILVNGKGRYSSDPKFPIGQPERFSKTIERGKKYLLRIINTSLATSFVFTIDGHNLTVIGSDFVSIQPYNTTKIVVGIGQRYHAILHANPTHPAPEDNYWIRTIPAEGCSGFDTYPDVKTGVLRYNADNTDDPISQQQTVSLKCTDEPYENLKPVLEWMVGDPANKNKHGLEKDTYEVGMMNLTDPPWHPKTNKSRWFGDQVPLWLNFGDPTIFNLDPEGGIWPNYLNIVTQDHAEDSWIYLVITASGHRPRTTGGVQFKPAAHPMHLHGHDFALLYQSGPGEKYNGSIDHLELKKNNPPRRDVVLLPAGGGFIVIAFKADNPGPWLLHCHIAWHASSGLAWQILENKHKMNISKENQVAMKHTCTKWKEWVDDVRNHYNNKSKIEFQDDSGI